jgi:hypothetical protein
MTNWTLAAGAVSLAKSEQIDLMTKELERAIKEVLEAFETPDSPEALVYAIYQLKRIYQYEINRKIKK